MIALIFTVLSVIVAVVCLWTTFRMKDEHLEHLNAVSKSAYKRGYEAGVTDAGDTLDLHSYRKGYADGSKAIESRNTSNDD